jgi:hypothetical protein
VDIRHGVPSGNVCDTFQVPAAGRLPQLPPQIKTEFANFGSQFLAASGRSNKSQIENKRSPQAGDTFANRKLAIENFVVLKLGGHGVNICWAHK